MLTHPTLEKLQALRLTFWSSQKSLGGQQRLACCFDFCLWRH